MSCGGFGEAEAGALGEDEMCVVEQAKARRFGDSRLLILRNSHVIARMAALRCRVRSFCYGATGLVAVAV